MNKNKSSETIKKEILEEDTIFFKPDVKPKRLCNGCGKELPEKLDNGLCPYCKVRN